MADERFKDFSPQIGRSSNTSPVDRGSDMLRRFRENKTKGIAVDPEESSISFEHRGAGENDFEGPSFFDAVADGSHIASMYSDKKRRDQGRSGIPRATPSRGPNKKLFDDNVVEPGEPIVASRVGRSDRTSTALREALSLVNELGPGSTTAQIHRLSSMLEDIIQNKEADRSMVQGFGISPIAKLGHTGRLDYSGIKTPLGARRAVSGANAEHQAYMESNLETEAANLQYYEEAIEELVEQLETSKAEQERLSRLVEQVEEERDGFAESCSGLGERLRLATQEYDEKLTRLAKEKEELRLHMQNTLETLKAEHKIIVEGATALESEIDDLRRRLKAETAARAAADESREAVLSGYVRMQAAQDESQVAELEKLVGENERLAKDIAELKRLQIEDASSTASQRDVVNNLTQQLEAAVAENKYKDEVLAALDSRIQSTELRNQQQADELRVLLKRVELLNLEKEAIESAKESVEVQFVQLQRELAESTSRRSVASTPTRGKKGSSTGASAAAATLEKDALRALVESQALLQQYEIDLKFKVDELESARALLKSNAAEIEELMEANKQYESLLSSMDKMIASPENSLSKQQQDFNAEYTMRLQIDLEKATEQVEELSAKVEKTLAEYNAVNEAFSSSQKQVEFLTATVKETKSTLAETNSRLAESLANEDVERRRAVEALRDLDKEISRNRLLSKTVDDSNARTRSAELSAAELRNSLLLLEQQQQVESPRVISSKDFSPAKHPVNTRGSAARMQDFLLNSDMSSPDVRSSSLTNDAVEKLKDQLMRVEDERDDLRTENNILTDRLSAKTEENFKLKEELQTVRSEISNFQSTKSSIESACQQELERKTVIIDELQETVNNLDLQIDNLKRLVEDRDLELQDERQVSDNLRNCLESRLEEENASHERLSEVMDDLAAREDELRNLRDRMSEFEEACRFREQALEAQLADQEAEKASIKDQAYSVQSEVQATVADWRNRLDLVQQEKADICSNLNALKEKCARLEIDLVEKASEAAGARKDLSRMVESLQFYKNRFELQMETLSKQADMWFDSFGGRVLAISATVNSRHNQIRSFRAEFDAQLQESQLALLAAMEKNDFLAEEREQLVARLRESEADRDDLERSLEEARLDSQLQQQDISRESLQNANEELIRLSERLEAAERRAIELSTNGAKAFARSSRTIAFLEGECARLSALADHFKGVNAKLSGDLRVMGDEALRVRGLEHRLKMAAESEVALLTRISSIENNLRSKEKELLLTMHSSQHQEEARCEQFEAEVRDLTEKLRVANEKHSIGVRESKITIESYETRLSNLTEEILLARETIDRLTIENSRVARSLESEELAAVTLKSAIRDRDDRIVELEGQISVMQHEKVAYADAMERRKAEFESNSQEKIRRIRELEAHILAVKKQLADTEASNMLKDDVISSALSKQSVLGDENRALRSRIETLVSDNSALLETNEELRSQLGHVSEKLSIAEGLFVELKDNTHRDTVSKLNSVSEDFRRTALELEMLNESHTRLRLEYSSHVERLAESEKRFNSLQSSLARIEGELQASQTTNTGLVEEHDNLRAQIEDLTMRVSSSSRELALQRAALQERENDIEILQARLKDMEDSLIAAGDRNNSFEAFEADLVNEMRAFADNLVTGAATTVMTREGVEGVPYSLDNDFFASPVPAHGNYHFVALSSPPKDEPGRRVASRRTANASALYAPTRSDGLVFTSLRQNFDDLKAKSETVLQQNLRLKEQLAAARKDLLDGRKRVDQVEQELRASNVEAERLAAQLEGAEDDLALSRREMSSAADERASLYASADEFAQNVRTQLRGLETSLADAVSRANAITAGRVITGANDKPVILSFQPSSPSKQQLVVSSRSSLDFGAVGLLSGSMKELDRTLAYLCSALEAVMADSTYKKTASDRAELILIDKERAWGKEKSALLDRVSAVELELSEVTKSKKLHESEVESLTKQVDSMRVLLTEFSHQKEELEIECRASMSNAEALQGALSEAESVCMDLRTKLRASQSDVDIKSDELNSIMTQLDICRKRIGENDLALEKITTNFARLKSEKDAVDGVRRSLEAELDRSRAEFNSLKLQARSSEEDMRSSYEVEKLLGALATTLDQVVSTMSSTRISSSGSTSAVNPNLQRLSTSSISPDASIAVKVESAVKRLTDFRNWARDESRTRRILEEKCDGLEQDLSAANTTTDGLQDQLRRAMQNAAEKSQELRDKAKEIAELQANLIRKQEEVEKHRREANTIQVMIEDEKKARSRLSAEAQSKDAELSRFRLENDNLTTTISRLTEQLTLTSDRLTEVSAENDLRGEQIKIIKVNNSRLSASLNMLEQGLDKDRSDRGVLEQRLIDVESTSAVTARLKVQVADLESALQESRDTLRHVQDVRDIAQRECHELTRDCDELRRKLSSTENRLEQSQRERIALQEECHNHRHAAGKLSLQLEQEQSSRLRAEATLEALQRAQQSRPGIGQDYVSMIGEVEDKILLSEEERNNLRSQNHALKLALEEKESQRHTEEARAAKLEREIQMLKSKLNMTSQEVEASNTRAAALRTEGRRARSQVLEAVAQIWEVVDIVRADAQGVGIELHTPTRVNLDHEDAMLGLEEALGVPELVTALDSMRTVVDFIREMPRNRSELESAVKRFEQDKVRLQKDLGTMESRYEERLQRLREELQQCQGQLAETRRGESSAAAGSKQVSALEGVLRQEREDKEKALELVAKLKDECDALTKDLYLVKKDLASQRAVVAQVPAQAEVESMKADSESLKREVQHLRKELQAVNHHRTVLRDTVEQVEKQLRTKVDALAESQFVQGNHQFLQQSDLADSPGSRQNRSHRASSPSKDVRPSASTGDEDEVIRRQAARYRARSLAMEELVTIYRAGIMALYPNGASYSAAQFGGQQAGSERDGLGVGWIEREVSNIKHSYEDEIRLLESEVNELRGKLKQSGSYISELRKRFEDNMKALYRNNRNLGGAQPSDGLLTQYEHVSIALEKAELEILEITHELAVERQEGKRRHAALVEDVARALQARDAALSAVKRLEISCVEAGMQNVTVYESLKAEMEVIPGAKMQDSHHSVGHTKSHSRTAVHSFDVDNIDLSERDFPPAPSSATKKRVASTAEKIQRLREREKEHDREREREERERSQGLRSSGGALRSLGISGSGKPLLAISHGSAGSKHSSPSEPQPFVVRHASSPAAVSSSAPLTAGSLKSSPPLSQRLSQAAASNSSAIGTGHTTTGTASAGSRHASPSTSYPLTATGAGSGSLRIARSSSYNSSQQSARHPSPTSTAAGSVLRHSVSGPTTAGYVQSGTAGTATAPFWFHHTTSSTNADSKSRPGSRSRGGN